MRLLLGSIVLVVYATAQNIGIYPWGTHINVEDRMQEIVSIEHSIQIF